MPIHALNHVGLSSPDLPRLVAFYRDLLGFAETFSFSWPVGTAGADAGLGLVDTSADVTILNAGNIYLEMFCFHTPEPRPQALDRPVQDEGITHLCLEVDDTDLVFARLRDGGAAIESEPSTVLGVVRIAAVRDPDGNIVELQQTLAPGTPTDAGALGLVEHPQGDADDDRRTVTPAPGVLGVNHVGLSTSSLAEHVAFYRDAAGLTELSTDGWDTEQSAATHTLLHAGNVYLDLTHFDRPEGRPQDPDRRIIEHGLNHLCFDVTDIDGLHAAMVEGGMTYHQAPIVMPAGLAAMGYAIDPFGNAVELVENKSTKAAMWCGHLRALGAG